MVKGGTLRISDDGYAQGEGFVVVIIMKFGRAVRKGRKHTVMQFNYTLLPTLKIYHLTPNKLPKFAPNVPVLASNVIDIFHWY